VPPLSLWSSAFADRLPVFVLAQPLKADSGGSPLGSARPVAKRLGF
jgi:hypothetical protein